MVTYDLSQQPNRLSGGLTLPASDSRPVAVLAAEHAGRSPLAAVVVNPMTWRGAGMVCGRGPAMATQGIGGTDVIDPKFNDHKFTTRVGPASCSPPV